MVGDTVDLRTAKDALGALANCAKPEPVESPRRPSGIETDPVVEDLEVEPAEWSDLQGYGDPARLGERVLLALRERPRDPPQGRLAHLGGV